MAEPVVKMCKSRLRIQETCEREFIHHYSFRASENGAKFRIADTEQKYPVIVSALLPFVYGGSCRYWQFSIF